MECGVIKKCLIIGLGQIGMGYDLSNDLEHFVYTHAKAFSIHPKFDLVGAVESSKVKRDIFKKNYDLPAYSEISEAINDLEPSIVVIAVPTSSHFTVIQEVLANIKPELIICEKPLAYNLIEATRILELCNIAKTLLIVNYMRRADPGSIEIKNRIDSGRIQEPIKGIVWYSKGFLHNGSHLFNLLEFWLGPFIKGKVIEKGRKLDNLDIEPDLHVEFKKGNVLFISAWEEYYSHYTIELLTKSGRLSYEREGESIFWQSIQKHPNIEGYNVLKIDKETIINDMNRYQLNFVDQIVNVLEGKKHSLSDGAQSLKTIKSMLSLISKG
jgi:predicted dehydrogenase